MRTVQGSCAQSSGKSTGQAVCGTHVRAAACCSRPASPCMLYVELYILNLGNQKLGSCGYPGPPQFFSRGHDPNVLHAHPRPAAQQPGHQVGHGGGLRTGQRTKEGASRIILVSVLRCTLPFKRRGCQRARWHGPQGCCCRRNESTRDGKPGASCPRAGAGRRAGGRGAAGEPRVGSSGRGGCQHSTAQHSLVHHSVHSTADYKL